MARTRVMTDGLNLGLVSMLRLTADDIERDHSAPPSVVMLMRDAAKEIERLEKQMAKKKGGGRRGC